MKLTWFGGTTTRIHIGGQILVLDANGAPGGIDQTELVSGADQTLEFGGELPVASAADWVRRLAPKVLDDDGVVAPVQIWRLSAGVLLVDATGEAPLVLARGEAPGFGRWGRDAVVVIFGDGAELITFGRAVLSENGPRLLALAGAEVAVDMAVPALSAHLDGAGLLALEAGMGVEV
ncbi:hypothetical protein PSQ90_15905 [Devosia rhodophyticola]|uniref:Uncharacterized protein n=1 Tax=Devosia rhodophyticola TaxID=3026423 RepID=A0ABY7YWK6_9HYPH|nr:hypothetical protein [Devosia rhodophyticola]WDR05714.1 hypothetical protein PSQ90_15905 [Devosia rhodophyticola]